MFIYDFFIPVIKQCDGTIYHLPKFRLKDSPNPFFLLPSIDPFDLKNDISAVSITFPNFFKLLSTIVEY